jgi:hypothetical protein
MKESFLHLIWKLQYFNKQNLITTQGENIHVLHPGILNHDSGPDFSNARIKIGDIEWYGNIEIHIKSSDWKLHHHHNDDAYNNVILHVTWNDDEPVRRDDGCLIPTIELKNKIDEKFILKYSLIINNKEEIPCLKHFSSVEEINKLSMLDKVIVERMQKKAGGVKELLIKNNNDWQETTFQVLAKNFGFKLNDEPFLRLARSLSLKSLLKHRDHLFQVEAILFGQAGLLDGKLNDEYPKSLKKEYDFLSHKFVTTGKKLQKSEWKFLRIRPANFPTIRIAEFASLIYHQSAAFTSLLDFEKVGEVKEVFKVKVSDYWKDHYMFDKRSEKKSDPSGMGEESIYNIIINSIVPFLFCYAKEKDNELYIERALKFLEGIPAEKNKITRIWNDAGLSIKNAFDSQGSIELFNSYCKVKNCLNCDIGVSIIKGKENIVDNFTQRRKEKTQRTQSNDGK